VRPRLALLAILLGAAVSLAAACSDSAQQDQTSPPPFFLTAQIEVLNDDQALIRSTLTWWHAEAGRWRYDLDAGGHDGEPPKRHSVFGAGHEVVTRAGTAFERIDVGHPAPPRLLSALLLGPVEARSLDEFIEFLNDLAGEPNATVLRRESLLGRDTTIVEVEPAFRGEANGVPTANGSVRYWIDETTMIILRAELDTDEAHALAEVIALDLDPTFPADPFFDPDA